MLATRCPRGATGLTAIQDKYGQPDRVCGAAGDQRGHALNGLPSPQTIYSRSAPERLGFSKTSPRWACPFLFWVSETPHSYAHSQSALCSASSDLGGLQSQKGGAREGVRLAQALPPDARTPESAFGTPRTRIAARRRVPICSSGQNRRAQGPPKTLRQSQSEQCPQALMAMAVAGWSAWCRSPRTAPPPAACGGRYGAAKLPVLALGGPVVLKRRQPRQRTGCYDQRAARGVRGLRPPATPGRASTWLPDAGHETGPSAAADWESLAESGILGGRYATA